MKGVILFVWAVWFPTVVVKGAPTHGNTYMKGVCSPGEYYHQSNYSCVVCPDGTFSERTNHQDKECKPCRQLTEELKDYRHLKISRECDRISDTVFRCQYNFFPQPDEFGFVCKPCKDHPGPEYAKRTLVECGAPPANTNTIAPQTTTNGCTPSATADIEVPGPAEVTQLQDSKIAGQNGTSPSPNNATRASDGDPDDHSVSVGLIVGLSVGLLVGIGVPLALLICYCYRKSKCGNLTISGKT